MADGEGIVGKPARHQRAPWANLFHKLTGLIICAQAAAKAPLDQSGVAAQQPMALIDSLDYLLARTHLGSGSEIAEPTEPEQDNLC
jgi:hypothetical protein